MWKLLPYTLCFSKKNQQLNDQWPPSRLKKYCQIRQKVEHVWVKRFEVSLDFFQQSLNNLEHQVKSLQCKFSSVLCLNERLSYWCFFLPFWRSLLVKYRDCIARKVLIITSYKSGRRTSFLLILDEKSLYSICKCLHHTLLLKLFFSEWMIL